MGPSGASAYQIAVSEGFTGTEEEWVYILEGNAFLVENHSGASIPALQAVYASGTLGASAKILIEPFIANGSIPARFFVGITPRDIPNGGTGVAVSFGKITDVNTNAWNESEVLYPSTTVAGELVNIEPSTPNFIIPSAFVLTKHAVK